MKKVINAPLWCVDGFDLPINCVKNSGCYVEILNAIYTQLMAMLSHHNKVLVVRVDIHFPNTPKDNRKISLILQKFKKRLSNKDSSLKRLGYVWVRESSNDGSIHYHLVYMLDGNKVRSSFTVNQLLDEITMFIGTKINIHYPTKGNSSYKMIKRNDKDAFSEAFKWLSYLAKERSKGEKSPTTNEYSASRLGFRDSPMKNDP